MSFIDECKDRTEGGLRWGVESLCQVLSEQHLGIAPATYYATKKRSPSRRALGGGELKALIAQVHAANHGVYGVGKMHAALARTGV